MNWVFVRTFLMVVLGVAAGRSTHALDYRDLTFYAPFDESFDPVISKGDPRPDFGKEKPTLGEGVIGRALIAGDPDAGLSYAVKGNLHDRNGSLSVWMKPLNWDQGDAQQHYYMHIPGRLLFYHYLEGGTTCFYWMRGSRVLWGNGGNYGGMKKNEWHHLTFTWGDGKCIYYLDGKYRRHVTDMRDDLPRWDDPPTTRFYMAPARSTTNGNNRTAFDELMIFNRPLSKVEVMALYRRRARNLPTPSLRIGRNQQAPTIDGKERKEEWDKCAGLTGFLDRPFGNLTRRDLRARLCYDDENLYVLVISEKASNPGGYLEVQLAAGEDAARERTLRFRVLPDGSKNVINGLNEKTGGAWNAAFAANAESETAEFAIPFSMIGLAPAKAESVRLNIVKRWSGEFGDDTSWADLANAGDQKLNPKHFGKAILGGRAPVLSVKAFGPVYYAKLDFQGELINPKDAPEKIGITARLQPTDLKKMVDEKFVTTWSGTVVDANRQIESRRGISGVSIKRTFKDTDINSVLVKATDNNGSVIYEQQVPFVCTPPILIEAKTYPKRGRVDIIADVSEYREARPGELSADIVFTDQGGKAVGQVAIKKFQSARDIVSWDLAKLPEGTVTVTASLKKLGVEEISRSDAAFTKLAPGPWMNSRLGLDDKVIAPFEPIRVEGQEIAVWNRTYIWKDSLLPVEIHTNGTQVLAAPLELYIGEKATGKPNRATITFKEKSDTRVRLEATGEMGGVPVTARTLVEYDGMIYIELVFGPQAATSVPKLALAMPVKTEHAWLYHHFGKGGAVAETENRRGPLKGNADVPARSFWLGTPDHGVTFFSPSFENWKLKGNRTPGHVKIDGPVTNYTVTVAQSAYPIKPGMRIAFGFIATPVRPMRENWRFFRCGRDWSYSWFGAMTNSNNHVTKMNPSFPEYLKKAHEKVPLSIAYIRPDWMNLAEKETPYYREEWKSDPWYISGSDGGGTRGENKHLAVCLGSDWQNFLLYHEMKIMDAANGDGFYHDGANPIDCKNKSHGHGYLDDGGKWHSEHAALDYRRYYKRLAVEMERRKGNWQDYLIWLHQSNHFDVPCYSFANMGWDGEQFSTAATASRDYTQLMTPEYFLAEFHGKQFGYPVQWLVEFFNKKGQPKITRRDIDTMLCLAFITGTQELTLASNLASKENYDYVRKVLDTADEFGLRGGRAEFIGWWENGRFIQQSPKDEKMKCSLWKGKGRVLVILGYANGERSKPGKTAITLHRSALGLTGNIRATDWWTKKAIPLKAGCFTVEVEGSRWRMIGVETAE
ncbi:MAG: glycoside hydrolase domain-containing protein [Pirellulales bacterium]